MHILVVDDEKAVLDLLSQLCVREGHDVEQAETAGEALEALRNRPIDILVTDIVMPGLDGLALVRRAKAIQPDVMCIVITGHSGNYSLEDVLDAGATDLILKPFRAPELRARLKLAAEQRRTVLQLKALGQALQATSAEMIGGLQKELGESRQTVARLVSVITRGEEEI